MFFDAGETKLVSRKTRTIHRFEQRCIFLLLAGSSLSHFNSKHFGNFYFRTLNGGIIKSCSETNNAGQCCL